MFIAFACTVVNDLVRFYLFSQGGDECQDEAGKLL